MELPSFLSLLPLTVGVVLCGMSLSGAPIASAQSARGPALTSPATVFSVPTRSPFLASNLRVRQGAATVVQRSTTTLSASDRWKALRDEVVAPGFLIGSLTIGLSDHLTDTPSRWGGDAVGYARRTGSTAGRLLIEAGMTHGIAAALHLDPRFVPRRRGSVGTRLRHAVLAAVTTRTPSGIRVPNVPRMAGTYGAALAEQQWAYRETRFRTAAYTLALSLGIDVAVNVVTEFVGSR